MQEEGARVVGSLGSGSTVRLGLASQDLLETEKDLKSSSTFTSTSPPTFIPLVVSASPAPSPSSAERRKVDMHHRRPQSATKATRGKADRGTKDDVEADGFVAVSQIADKSDDDNFV